MAARTLRAVKGPVIACGFSLGAIVAVEMWCEAPERIAGLVLLGYNASADLPERRGSASGNKPKLSRAALSECSPRRSSPIISQRRTAAIRHRLG